METSAVAIRSVGSRVGRFTLHYFEMCLPMCLGFAVGDALYFAVAGAFGYSEPFSDLPVLSVVVVTFGMTAPMTAWMLYRGMPRRAVWEMSAVMPVIGATLIVLGWLGAIPMEDIARTEHGLMMPAMLVPMLARAGLYSSSMHHQPAT
jgi:multisubunit Na+/H+ antiporter MnhG subunit